MKPHAHAKLDAFCPVWTDYELLDSGAGRKLERFGPITLVRPEPQATWQPRLPEKAWSAVHAQFLANPGDKAGDVKRGEWNLLQPVPPRWEMRRNQLAFWVQLTPSGHVGVFPDQASHWDWLTSLIAAASTPPKILSLFGHTGLATLSAAAAGAHVTHVDASRKAISWARENQNLSQLGDRSIRWLVDDASTFIAREVRRGRTYDGFILDPPRFGRGPQGQLWKAQDALPALLRECRKLLSPSRLFVLLNTYTTVLTSGQTDREAAQLRDSLAEMLQGYPVTISAGELYLADSANRRISASVFVRARF
ncbi:MAG TPA: class I SAM-dependent methyltransferase [Candidatus Methylomirabilis sp.]|nr:class I SAM-dependent methyltransferase [Candidatus Methylomirabilis sp.]